MATRFYLGASKSSQASRQREPRGGRFAVELLETRWLLSNLAAVRTDRADYSPGDFAEISGADFEPRERVTLQVIHADGKEGGAGHEPWNITASEDGTFTTTWYVHPDDSLGATFLLSAKGDLGSSASTTFTDSCFRTVTNTNNSGTGSLRQAILDANSNPGLDSICFNISGAGVRTIAPTSALPTITSPLIIDGTTQPGYLGTPIIELSGASAGASPGLLVSAGGSTIRGLAINRFTQHGVILQLAGGNRVIGNYIGTNAAGTADLGNAGSGIFVDRSGGNTIGGTTAADRNVVSGNDDNGIVLVGPGTTGNLVQGNYVGTNAAGSAAIGNKYRGLFIWNMAAQNTIGGSVPGAGNVISAAQNWEGVLTSGGGGNVLQGNRIGTNAAGTAALGNAGDGMAFYDSPNNLIGGTSPAARNIISANGGAGLWLAGAGSSNNRVQGNYIGTDISGANPLGNVHRGILLTHASNVTIGGTTADAGNVVSATQKWEGINISGGGSNVIQGNRVGTNAAGTAILGNGLDGILFWVSSNNLVGGTAPGAGNLISGNKTSGVVIIGAASKNNLLQGNRIGTDVTGSLDFGNLHHGIYIADAPSNTIGGTTAEARNVISGNEFSGLSITGSLATANVVQGNYIGTDANGASALGNTYRGIEIWNRAASNTIGGAATGAGNVISGTKIWEAVHLGTNANTVQGNLVGTNSAGTAAIANAGGFYVVAADNVIGGSTSGARNVIVASGTEGIRFTGAGASGNLVRGNFIGIAADGITLIGNKNSGISIDSGAARNHLGGSAPGEGNRIAGNGIGVGIFGDGSIENSIRNNAIYANTGLGIDLGPAGVTLNDTLDADSGPNQRQNYPELSSAFNSGSLVTLAGTLHSKPNSTFTLEFFANATLDPSGHGEGEQFIGSTTVSTNGAGNASFNVTFLVSKPPHLFYSATATDSNGNTSEFSAAVQDNNPPEVGTPIISGSANEGERMRASAVFSDLDGAGDAPFSCTVNYGDGTVVAGQVENNTCTGPEHRYADNGSYTISISVADRFGAAGANFTTHFVVNVPPQIGTVSLPPRSLTGETVAITVAFIDPGKADTHTCMVDWGDGTISNGMVTESDGSGSCSSQHIYASEGTQRVKVTVKDDDGDASSVVHELSTDRSVWVLSANQCESLSLSGNGAIDVAGQVLVNSSCARAVAMTGNALVRAAYVGVVGGVETSGKAQIDPSPTLGIAGFADPLDAVPELDIATLVPRGSVQCSGKTEQRLEPGRYSQIRATGNCVLTLGSGIYAVESGGLHASGNARITGERVSIYNASGSVTLSGKGSFALTPPAPDEPYAGVVLFQARSNSRPLEFTGTADGMKGTVYAPAATLSLSGNAELRTSLVVKALEVGGNGASRLAAAGTAKSPPLSDTNSIRWDRLASGVLFVRIDPDGIPEMHARIDDALRHLNNSFEPYGLALVQIADSHVAADVEIQFAATSPCGGQPDGVLGCAERSGSITIIDQWNWYTGENESVDPARFDFQTVVAHELGHAIGLGHSRDAASVMFDSLAPGTARRRFSPADLAELHAAHAKENLHAIYAHGFNHNGSEVNHRTADRSRHNPITWPPKRTEGESMDIALRSHRNRDVIVDALPMASRRSTNVDPRAPTPADLTPEGSIAFATVCESQRDRLPPTVDDEIESLLTELASRRMRRL